MSTKASRNKSGSAESTNPTPPISTPSFGSSDNWSLKALTELTGAVGKLQASIENLSEKLGEIKEDQRETIGRIDSVEKKMLVASTILSVLIVIGTAVLGAAAYVGDKAIDFGLDMAKSQMEKADSPPASAPATTTPPPAK